MSPFRNSPYHSIRFATMLAAVLTKTGHRFLKSSSSLTLFIHSSVLMVWYKERWLSPILRSFMETARELLKEHLSGDHDSL